MLHLLNFFSNFNSQQLLAFLKSQDLIISVTFLCQKQHKPLNMALKSASEDKWQEKMTRKVSDVMKMNCRQV